MHDHDNLMLTDAQCGVLRQFNEALEKGGHNVDTRRQCFFYEHGWKIAGTINGQPVQELAPTGRVQVCPACIAQLPMVLRELADIYEELAVALKLPEAKAKTKFGV